MQTHLPLKNNIGHRQERKVSIQCSVCEADKNTNEMYNNQYCSRCAETYRFCEACKTSLVRKSWRGDDCPSCEFTNTQAIPYRASAEDKIDTPDSISVKVTDINIPFGSMVLLIIKWTFASIPTAIILWLIWELLFSILSS